MNDLFNDMNINNSVMKDFNELDFRKQNSMDARERSLPKAGTDKAAILEFFTNMERMFPGHYNVANCKTIASWTSLTYHAVQMRMSELVRADLVEVAGKENGFTLYKIKEVAK